MLPLPAKAGVDRLDHVAWVTESAEGMRKYLAAKGWKVPAHVQHGAGGSIWFEVRDPEGNKVQFVEAPVRKLGFVLVAFAPNAIGHHIIHVGYMVHDHALEDTFYRDLLGFRPYWWGGRGGKVEWVAQQCPDGHDWMEYMITRGTTGVPADMTQRELGVMDHFSIGVVSVPDVFQNSQPATASKAARCRAEDRPGRQISAQYVRSRRHPDRSDELPRHREALLLAVHGTTIPRQSSPVEVRDRPRSRAYGILVEAQKGREVPVYAGHWSDPPFQNRKRRKKCLS